MKAPITLKPVRRIKNLAWDKGGIKTLREAMSACGYDLHCLAHYSKTTSLKRMGELLGQQPRPVIERVLAKMEAL
jgi:hypothetical protein